MRLLSPLLVSFLLGCNPAVERSDLQPGLQVPGAAAPGPGPRPDPTAGAALAPRHTPHAVPLAKAEHLLVRYGAQPDPALLDEAAALASTLVRPGERQDYARFLLAFVRQLQGRAEDARALLEQTDPDRRHFHDRFYSGSLEPVLPYLRANVALACQESPGPMGDRCSAYRDVPQPPDYRAFQQGSWVQHALDRLGTWGPAAAELSLPEFFAVLDIQPGMDVADVGAGDGWFAVPLARYLGPEGSLVANEVDPGLVRYLRHAADYHGLETMAVVQGGAWDVGLEPGSLDRVFVCEVLRHVYAEARQDPDGAAGVGDFHASLHRALRPGGQLVVIDHAEHPGDAKALPAATIQADLEAAGFSLLERSDRFAPLQVVLRFER